MDGVGMHDFSLASARAAAAADRTAAWVGEFLASRGSDNEVLAAAFAQERHWWMGPIEVRLDELERLAGPEADALVPIAPDEWEGDVGDMEESLDEGWEPPPLLAEYQAGRLLLQDGNHRYEALSRANADTAWVLVFFADADERDTFRRNRDAREVR
jgi:hypothetical protein